MQGFSLISSFIFILVPPLLSTSVNFIPTWKYVYVSPFFSKNAQHQPNIGATLTEYFGWLRYHPYWVLRFTPFGIQKMHTYQYFQTKMFSFWRTQRLEFLAFGGRRAQQAQAPDLQTFRPLIKPSPGTPRHLVPPLLSTSVHPRWSSEMAYVSAFWSKKAEITRNTVVAGGKEKKLG